MVLAPIFRVNVTTNRKKLKVVMKKGCEQDSYYKE